MKVLELVQTEPLARTWKNDAETGFWLVPKRHRSLPGAAFGPSGDWLFEEDPGPILSATGCSRN